MGYEGLMEGGMREELANGESLHQSLLSFDLLSTFSARRVRLW